TVLRQCKIDGLTEAEIREAVARFRGAITQVPPMYSAVKVEGRPLYKAARAGQTVARAPRPVTVHELDVVGVSGRDVELRVVCSKGTYVRTLCEDIGQALGVGGHLLSLERRRVGPLRVEQALTLEQVQAAVEAGSVEGHLLTLDEALAAFPVLALDDAASVRVLHGAPVPWEPGRATDPPFPNGMAPGQPVRLKDLRGRFLALGRLADGQGAESGEGRRVAVVKVFVDV
ncbi:MAG: tRNA pseudouridine synthase B, partial [Nitrospirales bacterium]